MIKTPLGVWRREAPVHKGITYRICGLSISLLLAAGSAAAAEAAVNDEEQYFGELPVVLSVTRLPQTPLELPASLTVIDQRMIEASGATDIPELLRLVAGFQIAHVGGTGYAVTYHGLGDDYARRTQVLVDGRSVYMPATSSVDWADLPVALEDIDRIEVLRGPNGEAFGDNSFSSVINIITKSAAATAGSFVRLQSGQGNYRRAVVRQGGTRGNFDYRLTLQHQSDGGLDDVVINNEIYSLKDDKQSNKVDFRGDYRAGVNDYLEFHAGTNSGMRGTGYNVTTSDPLHYAEEPAGDIRNWRHFEQLKWRHVRSSDDELQMQLFHNYTDNQYYYQTSPLLGPLEVQEHVRAERTAVELEHRFRVNEALRLVWGGEARNDKVIAEGYLNQNAPVINRMYRGFAHTEWRIAEVYLVNAGAMLEHNDIAGTHLSPRLAVNWQYAPDHAMRINATRAYRTPSILEEYADYSAKLVGDPSVYYQLWKSQGNLQSESITSYELGWMGNLNGPRNQYDFKFFKEYLRNIISHPLWLDYGSPIPANTIYFYNHDWADLNGFEGQLKAYSNDNGMLSFGYSHVHSRGTYTKRLNPELVESVESNVPTNTFSLLVEQRFASQWRGSLAWYHIDNIAFWHKTSVSTIDVQLARRFKLGGSEGELSLVARDITGSYYDYQDERVINPRGYVSLSYQW